MPAGTVFVGRPSRWGNPWTIDDVSTALTGAHRETWGNLFMDRALIGTAPVALYPTTIARHAAVDLYHSLAVMLRLIDPAGFLDWIDPLIGRDLACWCPDGERCPRRRAARAGERESDIP